MPKNSNRKRRAGSEYSKNKKPRSTSPSSPVSNPANRDMSPAQRSKTTGKTDLSPGSKEVSRIFSAMSLSDSRPSVSLSDSLASRAFPSPPSPKRFPLHSELRGGRGGHWRPGLDFGRSESLYHFSPIRDDNEKNRAEGPLSDIVKFDGSPEGRTDSPVPFSFDVD